MLKPIEAHSLARLRLTNAVIPGAGITATNTQTGSKYETVSTETGNYTLTQLPGGVYELTVELPGFKKYVRPGVTVLAATDAAYRRGSRSRRGD